MAKSTPQEIAEKVQDYDFRGPKVGAQFPENSLEDFRDALEIARTRYRDEIKRWEKEHGYLFEPMAVYQLYTTDERDVWELIVQAYKDQADVREKMPAPITVIQNQASTAFRELFSDEAIDKKDAAGQEELRLMAMKKGSVERFGRKVDCLYGYVRTLEEGPPRSCAARPPAQQKTEMLQFSMEELRDCPDPIIALLILHMRRRLISDEKNGNAEAADEGAENLDMYFDRLVSTPVDLSQVVQELGPGSTKSGVDHLTRNVFAKQKDDLLDEATEYEWGERAKLAEELLEGLRPNPAPQENPPQAPSNSIEDDADEEDIEDGEDDESFADIRKLLKDMKKAHNAPFIIERGSRTNDELNFRQHLRVRMVEELIASHGPNPELRSIDFTRLGKKMHMIPGLENLAVEITGQPLSKILDTENEEVRREICDVASEAICVNADQQLLNAINRYGKEDDFDERFDAEFIVSAYLQSKLPVTDGYPLGLMEPGLVINHGSGISMKVVTVSDNAIEAEVLGVPEAPWSDFAPQKGQRLKFTPTGHGSMWSCKSTMATLPLSLVGPPMSHEIELVTAVFWG